MQSVVSQHPSSSSAKFRGRPVELAIDLSAVESNVRAIKAVIGPNCNIMAVVKANAYGLGAVQMAGAALAGGATWLAVACVDEGIQLREAGYACPILVMGYVPPAEAMAVVEKRLTIVLHRIESGMALEEAARQLGLPPGAVNVHVKVDTGLGRYGCLPDEFFPLVEELAALKHLHLQGLMTHFAEADSTDLSFAHEQLTRFNKIRSEAAERGLYFDVTHACNSAGALALPEARFDLVRTGIMLGGHLPTPHLADKIQLRSAVTYHSLLARVYHACAGDSVGYGRTWKATRPSVIGLVPLGYADGFRRGLSNKGEVLVRGVRCPVVGRVSMDQFGVDLTDVHGASEGDDVVVIGMQEGAEITADEVADWAGTISYEVFTGISARVPRKYSRNGEEVGNTTLLGEKPTNKPKMVLEGENK